MKNLALLIGMTLVIFTNVLGQEKVSGVVFDSQSGQPLEGTSVMVKGTTIGVFSDANGNYSIDAPATHQTLVFTHIGKEKQEINIDGRRRITIAMINKALEMDEVVVTAFGIEKDLRALTSSVQAVKGNSLVKSRETNLVSALAGKIAGAQIITSSGAPGAGSGIILRGNASLNGSNQPLFVVDGIPVDNSQITTGQSVLAGHTISNRAIDINTEDIEFISVLKGPGAAALYGSRAANGVILITTKKGGSGKEGINFTYHSSLSFDQVNKLPELNQAYAQGTGGILDLSASTSWGPGLSDLTFDGDNTSNYSPSGNLIARQDSSSAGKTVNAADPYQFFKQGLKWDNHFSMTGGSEANNFVLSLSNTRQSGIIPNTNFARTSLRTGGKASLGKKFSVNSTLTYTHTRSTFAQKGSNVNGIMLGLLRTPPSFNNSREQILIDGDNRLAFMNPDGTQRNYRPGNGYDNPYWSAWMNPATSSVNRINGYAMISYRPLEWLQFSYRLGADSWTEARKQIFAIHSSGGNSTGSITEQNSRWLEVNSDFFIEAKHKAKNNIGIRLLLGNNLNHRFSQFTRATGSGLTIPEFYNLKNADALTAAENQSTVRLAGLFADFTLDLKGILYLNFTGRNDWASTFGKNNNQFFYPSASAGFVFTEAFGMQKNHFLPYGKLRVSYATAGKEPGPYLLNTVFVGGAAGGGFITGVASPFLDQNFFTLSGTLGNANLQPEKTTTLELGADLRFFKGHLALDIAYYQSISEGQIIPVQVPTSSGYFSVIKNAGTVENNGIELMLALSPFISEKGFNWTITGNFSQNRSLVTALTEDLDFLTIGASFVSVSTRAAIGQPYGVMYGGQFERTSDGQLIIDDQTGFPLISETEGIIGDPNPDWLLGINNSFSLNGFSISGLLDIRQGGDLWNGTKGALYYFGAHKDTEDSRIIDETRVFDGVLESSYRENESSPEYWVMNEQEVPIDENWYSNGPGSGFTGPAEQFIEDGSWFRLRELSFGYSIPESMLENSPLGNVEVFVTGRNVYLQTNYTGIDPETNLQGVSNGLGWDYFNMPNTKSWVGSIRISF